jgi:hypothetical protein
LDIRYCIGINLTNVGGSLDVFLMTVPWMMWLCFRRNGVPAAFSRLALFNVAWIPLYFFAARWSEVRYFVPTLLTCLPGLLAVLLPDTLLGGGRASFPEDVLPQQG